MDVRLKRHRHTSDPMVKDKWTFTTKLFKDHQKFSMHSPVTIKVALEFENLAEMLEFFSNSNQPAPIVETKEAIVEPEPEVKPEKPKQPKEKKRPRGRAPVGMVDAECEDNMSAKTQSQRRKAVQREI